MKAVTFGIAILTAVGASGAAGLEVFKCTSPRGAVIYQPSPCPPDFAQKTFGILPFSAGYDPSGGGTVFKREAELDRRRAEAAKLSEAESRDARGPEDPNWIGKPRSAGLPTEPRTTAREPFVAMGPHRH